MLLILILALFVIIVISFIIDNVILNPVVVMCSGFLVGSISFLASSQRWGIGLSVRTFWITILAIICFSLAIVLCNFLVKTFSREGKYEIILINYNLQIITVVTIFLQLFAVIFLYYSLKKITGSSELSKMISTYRTTLMSDSASDVRLPGLLNQILKVNMASSFVILFAGLYGRIILEKKKIIIYFIPIIFYAIESLLMGGRLEIIRTFIFIISVVYFLYCYKNKSVNEANTKALSYSKWIVVILPLFYFIKSFIGRTAIESFGEYILRYLGGPLASFEVFVNRNISYDAPFGQETFTGLYAYLSKKTGDVVPILGWIKSPTGLWVGNVYSGLRRYYYDFGFLGTLVMMTLLGLFFGYLFCNIWKGIKENKLKPFLLILYSFFLYSLVFEFFDDTFFSTAITLGSATQIAIMYIIYKLMFKKEKLK
ncbi:hypothetical protein OA78_0349 [Latilactobacillus curvatus]|uniref:O-antigen polymerase n=1 Tax=Latilactobacillus curvatus TaxID=28038 RepID=UPI000575B6F4|nr:O-antigen polymerase [Latilactobacillus curvatus]KHO13588.1 hypothetical protein OA78_0349 [Latilactobacillus curvatus]